MGAWTIRINGIDLDRIGNDCIENSTKFLGIYLDENLAWTYHITQVNNKVSRALFSIKQINHILPFVCLKTLFYLFINSHFSYRFIAWVNANRTTLKRVIKLQKHVMRIRNRKSYHSRTDPLFKYSNILYIHDLFSCLITCTNLFQYHSLKCLLEKANFEIYVALTNQIHLIFRKVIHINW